ncbi:MAG: hypothetical protein N3D73_03060 [Candidatus Diapherotrites archaeon]|nr:hypothetical protein [Candidatus Diapherotrites archaeon]
MLYKWIYDNLYTKDDSLLLGAVKKFCWEIGYKPDNMDEFARFLTNFDFVSLYDEVFNSPSFSSQIYDYHKNRVPFDFDADDYPYSSRVFKISDLYLNDEYIKEDFRRFFFSFFLKDKRKVLNFYFYKVRNWGEWINEEHGAFYYYYANYYKNLSLEEIEQNFYNWSILIILLEFPLKWVKQTLYMLISSIFSNIAGFYFSYSDRAWDFLRRNKLNAPHYLTELYEIYKFCTSDEAKGVDKYINFVKKNGYLQEIELRKKMLGELLAVSFIEYLALFISFWEKKDKDDYLYWLDINKQYSYNKGEYVMSFSFRWEGVDIDNFWIFHPLVSTQWGAIIGNIKNHPFMYVLANSTIYNFYLSIPVFEYPVRVQNIFYKYTRHVFSHPDLNKKMKEFLASYRIPTDWVNELENTLLYFLSFFPPNERNELLGNLSFLPLGLVSYGSELGRMISVFKLLNGAKSYITLLNSKVKTFGKNVRVKEFDSDVC